MPRRLPRPRPLPRGVPSPRPATAGGPMGARSVLRASLCTLAVGALALGVLPASAHAEGPATGTTASGAAGTVSAVEATSQDVAGPSAERAALAAAGARQVVGTVVRAQARWVAPAPGEAPEVPGADEHEHGEDHGDEHGHEHGDEVGEDHGDEHGHEHAAGEDHGGDGPETMTWIDDGSAGGVAVEPDDVAAVPVGTRVQAVVGPAELDEHGDALRPVLAVRPLPDGSSAEADTAGPGTGASGTTAGPGVLGPGDPGPARTAAALTSATHQVTVVRARPAGGVEPQKALAEIVDAVTGPVDDFWSTQTDGAVRFEVSRTLDDLELTTTCDDPRELWRQTAVASGFVPGSNQHLMVYVGDQGRDGRGALRCAAGLGTVGRDAGSGGLTYVSYDSTSVVAHELGHNMGLLHSSRLRCPGAAADGAFTGGGATCQVDAYRDYYDVMGIAWGPVGSLNAVQSHELGALGGARAADVPAAGGRATLVPVAERAGVRALRLRDADGSAYWVELRAAVGRDAWLSTTGSRVGLQTGVTVRRDTPAAASDGSLLLDTTPTGAAFDRDREVVLPPGGSVLVADGRWRITAEAAGSTSATVSVAPARAGVAAAPDGTLTGPVTALGSPTPPPSTPAPAPAPPPSTPGPGPMTPPTPDPDPVPPPTPDPAPAPGTPVVPDAARYQGTSRYGTAVSVSRASHPGTARTVVVASGEAFPDALAAGPVAAAAGGPLLLVPRGGPVGDDVMAELSRLSPQRVVLAGGRGAVDDAVAARLAAVAPVQRVSGGDRYDTAARLATSAGKRGGTVYLASGATYADAVAGGALAAREGSVVLLTARDALPGSTREALAAIAPDRVVLLGGAASVGPDVQAAVGGLLPGTAVERRGGRDRYDTAAQVALAGYPDGAGTVWLATGDAFADALAGGPAAGGQGAPLLLTTRTCVPAATADALVALGAQRAVVLGGASAVGADALRRC